MESDGGKKRKLDNAESFTLKSSLFCLQSSLISLSFRALPPCSTSNTYTRTISYLFRYYSSSIYSFCNQLDVQVIEEEEEQGLIMDDGGFKKFYFSGSDEEVSSVGSVDSFDDSHNNSSSQLNYSLSSSPNSPFSYSNNSSPSGAGAAMNDMSSLLQQLPIKRGLSKHFEGKSQSFTCLSNVRCLEDLAKPENPYNKKLKSCKSYVGLYGGGCQKSSSNQHLNNKIPRSASSRQISKKTSRPSYSSLLATANRNTSSIMPPTYS